MIRGSNGGKYIVRALVFVEIMLVQKKYIASSIIIGGVRFYAVHCKKIKIIFFLNSLTELPKTPKRRPKPKGSEDELMTSQEF